jgi:SEFIR domain
MHVSAPERPVRAFVSYSWDSPAHKEQVFALCRLLREEGIEVRLDQWAASQRRDWAGWATKQIETADFVIVVGSPSYKVEADSDGSPTGRWGVNFEAAVLRELLCADRRTWMPKILPVLLPGGTVDDIPIFLQPRTATHYVVGELTAGGVCELLKVLRYRPEPEGGGEV